MLAFFRKNIVEKFNYGTAKKDGIAVLYFLSLLLRAYFDSPLENNAFSVHLGRLFLA